MSDKDCENCGRKGSSCCPLCVCVTAITPDGLTMEPSNWIPVDSKNYESKDEMVSHPSHYQSETGLETINVIEAFTANLKGIEAVDTANVIKYICRWKRKNGLQDLEKAKWYLQHLINHVEDTKKTVATSDSTSSNIK